MNYQSAKHSIDTWDERDILPGQQLGDLQMETGGGSGGHANHWRDSTSSGDSAGARSRDSHASAESVKETQQRRGTSRGSSFSGHDFVDNTEHCSYNTVIRRKSSGSENSTDPQQHKMPTKMMPNLPVTTEITKQLSEQVAAHAQQRRSDETLRRIKHGAQNRNTDPPPPPPPAVPDVPSAQPQQQFPPPPSPLVNSPRRSVPKQGSEQGAFNTRVSDTSSGLMVGVVGRQQQQQQQPRVPPASPAKPPLPPDQHNATKNNLGAMSPKPPGHHHHPQHPPVSPLSGVHGAHVMTSQQHQQGVVQSVPNSPLHTAHPAVSPHGSLGHRRSGSTGAPPPAVAPKPKPPTPQRRDSAGKAAPPPPTEAKPDFMQDLQRVLAQKQAMSGSGAAPVPKAQPGMHNQTMGSPAHVARPPLQHVSSSPQFSAQHQHQYPQPPPTSPGLANPEDLPPPPAELLEGLPKTNTPSLKKKPPPPPRRSSETQLSSPRHQPHKPSS